MGGWSGFNRTIKVDDTGLRNAGGTLQTEVGVPFRTPPGEVAKLPSALLLQTIPTVCIGAAQRQGVGIYLLVTGTTHPQFSRVGERARNV